MIECLNLLFIKLKQSLLIEFKILPGAVSPELLFTKD